MKRSWISRTILAAALGLAVLSGLVRGGEPPVAMSGSGVTSEVVDEGGAPQAEGHRRLLSRLRPVGIRTRIHNVASLGCYGNFNDYSCGSLHSERQFIFGSCRTFYGERCLKGPPPSPVPGFDLHALGLDKPRCGCP